MSKRSCPKCQSQVSENDKFCSTCGFKLDSGNTGVNRPIISSQDISALIKDAQEESWRQLEAIQKLGQYQQKEALDTLFKLAFSETDDQRERISGGEDSWRLRQVEFASKNNSKVRWTAADSIAQMGDFAFDAVISELQDRMKFVEAYQEERSTSRGSKSLLLDVTLLIWIIGESSNYEAKNQLEEILNSRKMSKEFQESAMNALVKLGPETKEIFISNLNTDEEARRHRYYLASTALACFGDQILPDIMKKHSLDAQIRVIDILNHLYQENFNEKILDYYITTLSEFNLVTKGKWKDYETDKEAVALYAKIRTGLLSDRDKSIEFLKRQVPENQGSKIGLIRAMGLMDDAMFLQPLINYSQDQQYEIREEALKWYKRLNHKFILYQDSSDVPEMDSFEDEKSYVDMTLIEPETYLEEMKEVDFKPKYL